MKIEAALAICFAIFVCSCELTEDFYNEQENIPQPAEGEFGYLTNYAVGDTIAFYGRFGSLDSDLRIRIGDVEGKLVKRYFEDLIPDDVYPADITFNGRIQVVNVPVTEAMGIGPDRPVHFILNGQTAIGRSIYIRGEHTVPFISDTLQIRSAGFDFSSEQFYFIKSWNGSGRVFYFNLGDGSLNRWDGSGFDNLLAEFEDEQGVFSVKEISGAAVDRQEKALYFSAVTENAGSTSTSWRLCKVDLATLQLTTLNHTAMSLAGGPWEGPLSEVKLPLLPNLYAAEDGTLYFNTGTSATARGHYFDAATARIDANHNLTYIAGTLRGTSITKPPIDLPKGVNRTVLTRQRMAIDPDRGWFYFLSKDALDLNEHFRVHIYSLDQQRELYSFLPENADLGRSMVLGAPFGAAKYDQGGAWFLQAGKPVFFIRPGNSRNSTNAVVSVDFENSQTAVYAPFFQYKNKHRTADTYTWNILNYTPDGHIMLARPYDRFDEPDRSPLHTLETTQPAL